MRWQRDKAARKIVGMKIYEFILKPLSGFATPMKGDTIFGHICWLASFDEKLFGKTIGDLLSDYDKNPFAVISSAFPCRRKDGEKVYFFKKPDMPCEYLFEYKNEQERDERGKQDKRKQWMLVNSRDGLSSLKDRDGTLYCQRDIFKKFSQWHNTINRKTGKTGKGIFAPYSVRQFVYEEDFDLVVFTGIDEKRIKIEALKRAFEKIGKQGFGKDASTGLGKFEVMEVSEIDLKNLGSENPLACYTLSPCVPEKGKYRQIYFEPFVRFGKHGGELAKINPFKNPVIMADEGAIFIPEKEEVFEKAYLGSAVFGVSEVQPEAVTQGYSLFIPVRIE